MSSHHLQTCKSSCRYGQANCHHCTGLHREDIKYSFIKGKEKKPTRQNLQRVGPAHTLKATRLGEKRPQRQLLGPRCYKRGGAGSSAPGGGNPPSCGGREKVSPGASSRPAAPLDPRRHRDRGRSQRPPRAAQAPRHHGRAGPRTSRAPRPRKGLGSCRPRQKRSSSGTRGLGPHRTHHDRPDPSPAHWRSPGRGIGEPQLTVRHPRQSQSRHRLS